MKKKILSILFLFVLSFVLTSANVPYAKKCTKCIETAKNNKNYYPSIGIMCRDFTTPHKKINGKVYFCYRCQFGHEVWVNPNE